MVKKKINNNREKKKRKKRSTGDTEKRITRIHTYTHTHTHTYIHSCLVLYSFFILHSSLKGRRWTRSRRDFSPGRIFPPNGSNDRATREIDRSQRLFPAPPLSLSQMMTVYFANNSIKILCTACNDRVLTNVEQ